MGTFLIFNAEKRKKRNVPNFMRREIFLLLALVLLSAGSVQAAYYYISPNGSDINPGTTAQPFQTLQYCISLWDNATQISCRGEGIFHESVVITKGGPSPDARNQLIAWDTDGDGDLTDETFVLDGEGTRPLAIDVSSNPTPNPDNIEIAYLTIENYKDPNCTERTEV